MLWQQCRATLVLPVPAAGATAPQQVEVLSTVWLQWVVTAWLQWAETQWVTHWAVPIQAWLVTQWVVIQWVVSLMEQWLLWIPQLPQIWLKAWKLLIQLLTPPTLRRTGRCGEETALTSLRRRRRLGHLFRRAGAAGIDAAAAPPRPKPSSEQGEPARGAGGRRR